MYNQKSNLRNRGEIAAILTLISAGLMIAGAFAGSKIAQQGTDFFSKAASTKVAFKVQSLPGNCSKDVCDDNFASVKGQKGPIGWCQSNGVRCYKDENQKICRLPDPWCEGSSPCEVFTCAGPNNRQKSSQSCTSDICNAQPPSGGDNPPPSGGGTYFTGDCTKGTCDCKQGSCKTSHAPTGPGGWCEANGIRCNQYPNGKICQLPDPWCDGPSGNASSCKGLNNRGSENSSCNRPAGTSCGDSTCQSPLENWEVCSHDCPYTVSSPGNPGGPTSPPSGGGNPPVGPGPDTSTPTPAGPTPTPTIDPNGYPNAFYVIKGSVKNVPETLANSFVRPKMGIEKIYFSGQEDARIMVVPWITPVVSKNRNLATIGDLIGGTWNFNFGMEGSSPYLEKIKDPISPNSDTIAKIRFDNNGVYPKMGITSSTLAICFPYGISRGTNITTIPAANATPFLISITPTTIPKNATTLAEIVKNCEDKTTQVSVLYNESLQILPTLTPEPPPADTTAPDVYITPIAPNPTFLAVTAKGIAMDTENNITWVKYSINDETAKTDCTLDTPLGGDQKQRPFTCNITIPPLTIGSHTIHIWASDSKENIGETSTAIGIDPSPTNYVTPTATPSLQPNARQIKLKIRTKWARTDSFKDEHQNYQIDVNSPAIFVDGTLYTCGSSNHTFYAIQWRSRNWDFTSEHDSEAEWSCQPTNSFPRTTSEDRAIAISASLALFHNHNSFGTGDFLQYITVDGSTDPRYRYTLPAYEPIPTEIVMYLVSDSTNPAQEHNASFDVPALNPADFKAESVILPQLTTILSPTIVTDTNTNEVFSQVITKYSTGKMNALEVSSFISQISRTPGIQTSTCDPAKGECTFEKEK